MKNVILVDKKIDLDAKKYIVSKTDTKGVIIYANDYFVEISGYTKDELLNQPHNMIRHPDMPRIVFKLMWDRIKTGQNIMAVVKNLAKSGKYYWVITEFESKKDKLTNKIISYTAFRKAAPVEAIEKIEPIYKTLCELEKNGSMDDSEKYLREFLQSKQLTYDQFINDITSNKGMFKIFFKAMKKIFG